MKKKLVSLFTASMMILSLLTGCSEGNKYTIKSKKYPMRTQLSIHDEIKEDEITLYFMNGQDIPYVSISEYMPFIGSIYKKDKIGIPAAEYEITHPFAHRTAVERKDNSAVMEIDTELDTIEFVGMDYFTAVPDNSLLLSVISVSGNGRGGSSNLLKDAGESYERNGDALIKFDLSKYHIDLIEKDGQCYVPLQTMNDLLVSRQYVYVVFNQKEVIACTTSSELINDMYKAPTGKMSKPFAKFNYNELRFMLDSFYGLKPEHGITDFAGFFESIDLIPSLSGTDPEAFDKGIQKLTLKYLDDGHSLPVMYSYLTGDGKDAYEMYQDVGTSTSYLMTEPARMRSIRFDYYPNHPEIDPFEGTENPWFYEEVGDTAIITFDYFTVGKTDYYKEADLNKPSDTIELISYAQSQITRQGSPIKNVVIDLSCNSGGNVDAAVFLMAWLKPDGEAPMGLKNTLTQAQSIGMYEADINLDGEFDDDDYLPAEIHRYILTSPASFSCGNLVPSFMKGSINTTIIGQTSGGGACIVRPCTSACGSVFNISSNLQISTIKNGSLYNVDQGVVPDVYINSYETFFERSELVDFIHNLR